MTSLDLQDGPRRAVEFLRRRGLDRIVEAARGAYWRNSGVAGRIALEDATDEEHTGLAALTGRTPRHGPLRVRLADLDGWLREAFSCSLEEALTSYDGVAPSRREQERARADRDAASRRERWQERVARIAGELPDGSLGRTWLEEGAHGGAWIVDRFEGLSEEKAPAKEDLVRLVGSALARLPLAEPRRLAAFANDVAGNPHAFDPGEEAGRLLFLALLDLHGAELGLDPGASGRLAAADRRALGERVGLLGETLSSTVAVYGLRGATRRDGGFDVSVAVPPLQILPLRRLVGWREAHARGEAVFVVENPVVFEDLIEGIDGAADEAASPTLVCTAGWPSLAATRLLDLLVAAGTRRLFYSGDFDPSGLRIAANLRQRYPDQFVPWRLGPDDYRTATHAGAAWASPGDLRQLDALAAAYPDLVPEIQTTGRWAYQEALTPLLLRDLIDPVDSHRRSPTR